MTDDSLAIMTPVRAKPQLAAAEAAAAAPGSPVATLAALPSLKPIETFRDTLWPPRPGLA